MLCLSSQDIEQAATPKEITAAVEKSMLVYESGDFIMPDRMHVGFGGNTLLLMPCFSGENFATKLLTVNPENNKVNKPAIYATVVLNDGVTGEPLALINGSKLTAMRTGAVGGIGIRYLAGEEITRAGLIGTGVQGFHQLLFACSERNIREVCLYDRNDDKVSEFAREFSARIPGVKVTVATNSVELQERSQLIIVATTSKTPVLSGDPLLLKDRTYIAIGSYQPDYRELPDELFGLIDQCFIDTFHAVEETGDIAQPLRNGLIRNDQIHTIGKLINGSVKLSAGRTRVFKSVGMALFDLFVAGLVYRQAVEKSIGTKISLT